MRLRETIQTNARTQRGTAGISRWSGAAIVALAVNLTTWVGVVRAHEPIFGIGPHTMHRYGVGFEVERESGEDESGTRLEAVYGVTEDIALTLSVPRHEVDHSAGWGSLLARSKWRFYRDDGRRGSNQAAVVFGTRFPAFQRGARSPGYLFGVTAGREARREYLFGGLRYMLNTADGDGFRPGNAVKYDLAAGIRPIPGDYEDPDLVVLLELNGTYTGDPTPAASATAFTSSAEDITTGGRIGVGPGLILTYKNIMLKAGVDFIVMAGSKGVRFGEEVESVLAIESHFSPFSFIYGQ